MPTPLQPHEVFQVDKLHHYCSMEAAVKIIENKTLRFSSIDSMNDTSEVRYFLNVAMENLHLIKSLDPSQYEVVKDYFRAGGDVELRFMNMFCFCASSVPDDLSQWRGYADDGYGAAVCFRLKGMNSLQLFASTNGVTPPYPICYTLDKLKSMLASINVTAFGTTPINSMLHWFNLETMGPLFKAPKFAAEEEWRMIFCPPDPELKIDRFRTMVRRKNVVPCYDFEFDPNMMQSIQVGPNVSKRTQAALAEVLKRRGFKHVTVTHSEITYQT